MRKFVATYQKDALYKLINPHTVQYISHKKGIKEKNGYLSKGARSGAFSPVTYIQQFEYVGKLLKLNMM
jgi:hypothetical protein